MKPSGKVIVVTGAGSGMGREVALELLRRGAKVAAVDLNEATLKETAGMAADPGTISTHVLNITDRAGVEALPQIVIDRFGAVDGVFNCAGIIQPFVKLAELEYSAIDRVMDVNFRGTLYMTKSLLPHLLKRPEAHVVNISSMGGFLPVPGQSIYGASKAAVKLMTEGLWAELADTNVHVTVIFPGAVATNITTNSGVSIPAMGGGGKQPKTLTAAAAALEILKAFENNAFRACVGGDSRFLDRFYRLSPKRATALIAKQMKSLLAK